MKTVLRTGMLTVFVASCLLGDVTYSKTLRYTGGSMLGFLRDLVNSPLIQRMVGGDFGAALDDQSYTIYVKGSKMAQATESGSTIYDLDAGTVTIIDNDKQTYSVETFDELRGQIERAEQWMKHPQAGPVPFDVRVEKTEERRRMGGLLATKSVVTLTAQSENAWGKPVVQVTTWLAPVDAGMRPLNDFSKRAAEKLGSIFTLIPSLFGAAGGSAATRATDVQKLSGISVLDEIAVTGVTTPLAGLLGGRPTQANVPVVELEIGSSHFVVGAIDSAKFRVPAGYRREQQGN